MIKIKTVRNLFSLSLVSLSLIACGRDLPMQYGATGAQFNQRMRANSTRAYNRVPNLMNTFNSNGRQRFSSYSSSGFIKNHFVPAYKGAIADNEPISRNDPNSPANALERWIDGAQQSLDGSFYDIKDPQIVGALVRAAKRGVKVRIVTDDDSMTDNGAPRPAIVQLKQAGIPVIDDQRSAIMHNKFLIIDNSVVWSGSTNLTTSSLHHHNNHAISIESPKVVENFNYEFGRMFNQRIFGPRPPRQVPYPSARVGRATVQTYFSPKGGGKDAVVRELQSAQKHISFMTFSLTDKTAGSVMINKMKSGVKVQGVFDRWLGAGQYSLYEPFKAAGMPVLKDGNQALLHHKIILIDNTVITGSFNYSDNAERSNNENFFIIKNSAATTKVMSTEFKKVWNAAKYNRPPRFIPRHEDVQESKSVK